jgi:SRSO17 transposase
LAGRFTRFHLRFKEHFQNATRSVIEPVGPYLKGLMQGDPNKNNMERMEEKVPNADEQQLQHMLSDSPWDHRAVIDQVALEADGLLGGNRNSCLLIDESGFKKSGSHSVGVGRQWCGRLGKVENCQVGVFAALGCDQRVTLVDERLYLPEKWSEDPQRCEQLGVKCADPSLFAGVPWGTGRVASLTRERMRALGWRWHELPTLWDLDRPQDLERLQAAIPELLDGLAVVG